MGETRWNRKATSGNAASQTTVEATTPSTRPAPTRRSAVRHQGSSRRSRSSSGERGPKSRLRIVSHDCRTSDARRWHQPDERADRQEGELAADVEQIHGIDAPGSPARRATGCWRAGPAAGRSRPSRTSRS